MKKLFLLFLLVTVLLTPASGCYSGGPWKGKVIDSETKQPIEGAAVVAIWEKEYTIGPSGSATSIIDLIDMSTDKSGEFSIPSRSYLSVPVVRSVSGPRFIIYKPGYGSFPNYQAAPKVKDYEEFSGKGATVCLPKFTKDEDRLKALREAEINIPKSKIKNLLRNINIERNYFKFDLYKED